MSLIHGTYVDILLTEATLVNLEEASKQSLYPLNFLPKCQHTVRLVGGHIVDLRRACARAWRRRLASPFGIVLCFGFLTQVTSMLVELLDLECGEALLRDLDEVALRSAGYMNTAKE